MSGRFVKMLRLMVINQSNWGQCSHAFFPQEYARFLEQPIQQSAYQQGRQALLDSYTALMCLPQTNPAAACAGFLNALDTISCCCCRDLEVLDFQQLHVSGV